MSYHVASACMQRKFGSATRKQIIGFMADKASDDGSGIWCSKGTIAQNTELSKSTVKRVVFEFLKEGIISETGQRANSHGFTVEYRINLDRVESLSRTSKPSHPTGATVNPVPDEPPIGVTVDPREGSPRTPNHSLTILEPPTRTRAAEEVLSDFIFEEIWKAYPQDRRRNKKTCLAEFTLAVSNGIAADDILSAVREYNTTTAGYTRGKVKFSDNWFRGTDWKDHIQRQDEKRKADVDALATTLKRCEAWIKARDPMCRHITKLQLNALLENGKVTSQMLTLAGVAA